MFNKKIVRGVAFVGALMTAQIGLAQDVQVLDPSLISARGTETVAAGTFQKEKPWTIGFSWPGVGNSWIIQTIQEIHYEADQNSDIAELKFSDAGWQPAKQVADIEDLLTSGIDALVVLPINPDLVKTQIETARSRGIPVIAYTPEGTTLDADVVFYGGGEFFGKVGGDFLVDRLGGKGTVWAFRGVAGSSDDITRYNGFTKALEGSDIKIGAEVYGDWNYAKSKQVCENLVATGQPVDGIWFSGAEMTRACLDVFTEIGKPLVPMTGENNNGFLRIWKDAGLDSAGPVFTPGLGPAMVRAAVALLDGKGLPTQFESDPAPITSENFDQLYRPDLSDAYWMPSTLPEDVLMETFKR
jgi:ribose transport system substrate-binding protein